MAKKSEKNGDGGENPDVIERIVKLTKAELETAGQELAEKTLELATVKLDASEAAAASRKVAKELQVEIKRMAEEVESGSRKVQETRQQALPGTDAPRKGKAAKLAEAEDGATP